MHQRQFLLHATALTLLGAFVFAGVPFAAERDASDAKSGSTEKTASGEKTDKKPTPPAASAVTTTPVPVAEAAAKMTVPEGFHVSLVAGEPDVVQPIAFTFDDRGRLWVCECLSYPKWAATGHDRITIFENDGKGNFKKKKVFWDQGNYLTGIELGFGGVWVCCAPNIYFIPADFDADDPTPKGEPEVVLDGWSTMGKHNVVNGLIWGPDGWLWGLNGITAPSKVGKPGTPDKERININCGVWRYHPTRKEFEVVAHGTTNPWGLDFDDYGQAFITNCVIGHLFHVIPGAHFKRMFGSDLNPYVYDYIDACSDHLHWGGGAWQTGRGGAANSEAGGGHAHCGAMVYLGDNLPEEYRNTIFMCNIHGNRVNNDKLEKKGSGYVAHHGKDFLLANDEWFRGVAVHQGPDGAVYVADWSDTGECHNYDRVDRETGRIYRVAPVKSPQAFVEIDDHYFGKRDEFTAYLIGADKNEWYVRHARRFVQEHPDESLIWNEKIQKACSEMLDIEKNNAPALHWLFDLHVAKAASEEFLRKQTHHDLVSIRQWAVRFLVEDKKPSDATLAELLRLAKDDKSPAVRLEVASGLQRIPFEKRWEILEALLAHEEDAKDQNLPLMDWYAVEPLVPGNTQRVLGLAAKSKIPLVREFIARRIAGETTKETKGN